MIGPVMEQGVGQRSAHSLMEQNKHEGGFDPFIGEPVAIAASDTFEQTVGLAD